MSEAKTEEKKFGFLKRTWKELKAIVVVKSPVKQKSGAHSGAVSGPKIMTRHWFRSARKLGKGPTNHERVIEGRAERMRISVAEYKRRFCDL